jgi:hypothetical protein
MTIEEVWFSLITHIAHAKLAQEKVGIAAPKEKLPTQLRKSEKLGPLNQ